MFWLLHPHTCLWAKNEGRAVEVDGYLVVWWEDQGAVGTG